MSEHDALIRRIARLAGIAEGYLDQTGKPVETSFASQLAILEGLGLSVGSKVQAQETLTRIKRVKNGILPMLIPVEAGQPVALTLRGVTTDRATWRVTEETGSVREGDVTLGTGAGEASLSLPALSAGYHKLHVEAGEHSVDATMIAAPRRGWEPENLKNSAKLWGATAQVYSLKSRRNLGIGDYTDVLTAAEGIAGLGGSFLGLSPVHALFTADRTKISPYSPSSRLFLEPIFIDPTTIEGFKASDAARILDDAVAQRRLTSLRSDLLIDHEAVWNLKRHLLDALWVHFQSNGRNDGFAAFRQEGGESLEAHATFEALCEFLQAKGYRRPGDWPETFRDAHSADVETFRTSCAERVDFHAWLQWQANRQLAEAAERARSAGMSIGLYRDLAVGSDAGGSEVWAHPERFAPALAIGAPPDPLGPQGQNWGLPPFNPLTLEEQGLTAFRALVSANMRHAGAIRIDHAFQLQRLFLIPAGMRTADGAYVAYPVEAMLAVLRLESHRRQCLVIAEDLGTGPAGFSDMLMNSGILSYRVLFFEREKDGTFKRPADYPRSALAVTTTHDLPTFRGWWRGLDIDLRQTLGVYDPATADQERVDRSTEIRQFCEALAAEDLLPTPEPPKQSPFEPATRYLARTPSALIGIQLEDASGEFNQANMPGLDGGHPNWKRKLAADIGDIVAPGGPLARLASAMADEGRDAESTSSRLASPPPRATYRLQFHKDFTFDDAVEIIPYLAELGISHVYSSPIQTARAGSMHGYDVVDHGSIDSELGGEAAFYRLSDALNEHGLGLILDIVPNHMGIGAADNAWWLSTLEWGDLSPAARAFDIDWDRSGAGGKLILPFLSAPYGDALEKGELKLDFDGNEGSFSVWHWEHRFPICPLTYPAILDVAVGKLDTEALQERAAILTISERLRAMSREAGSGHRAVLPKEGEALKQKLSEAVAISPTLRKAVDQAVHLINGSPTIKESFGTLHRILEAQSYRLAHWRVASSDINFRRFFDVNTLGGLRVEDEDIFERSHAMIFRLIREGRIQGLRIDHVDGLADPEGYTKALQRAVGPGFYIVVEKILEREEALRPWPIAGTSGYDALNWLDGVFIDKAAAEPFETIYRSAAGLVGTYEELLRDAKSEILEKNFASELGVVVTDLKRLADGGLRTRDLTRFALHQALVDIIVNFPVYRSYIEEHPSSEDRHLIERIVEKAKASSTLPDGNTHNFIANILLDGNRDKTKHFRRRFQQLSGPVMAKSLEDTLFYRYVRLLSLNEVGGAPERFGVTLDEFHHANSERRKAWPYALIATATHDTKRGEDARSRLNSLSEAPELWIEMLELWNRIALPLLADEAQPDRNDQYMLLQAILGAWPIALLQDRIDADAANAFRERMATYVVKALREAKRHTGWLRVNETYEKAAIDLVRSLLDPNGEFLGAFRPHARKLAEAGRLTSLSRTILKCTIPGIPDIYQGTEFWDLSLVDPDNRRPVDYRARTEGLKANTSLEGLLAKWPDGRVKQHVLARLLADRAASPTLYAKGDYIPLAVSGAKADHIIAFMRTSGHETLIVAVSRLTSNLTGGNKVPLGSDWKGTGFVIRPGRWRDVMMDRIVETGPDGVHLDELFTSLPFAVLRDSPT